MGLLKGHVRRFSGAAFEGPQRLKVPQIGWNALDFSGCQTHPLFAGIASGRHVYFVHSYYVDLANELVIGECEYGVPFAAMFAHKNLVAVQFHPEKSDIAGLKLLRNFLSWNGHS